MGYPGNAKFARANFAQRTAKFARAAGQQILPNTPVTQKMPGRILRKLCVAQNLHPQIQCHTKMSIHVLHHASSEPAISFNFPKGTEQDMVEGEEVTEEDDDE